MDLVSEWIDTLSDFFLSAWYLFYGRINTYYLFCS